MGIGIAASILQFVGVTYLAFDYWKSTGKVYEKVPGFDGKKYDWANRVGEMLNKCTCRLPRWMFRRWIRKFFELDGFYQNTHIKVKMVFFCFTGIGLALGIAAQWIAVCAY